jgi:hypothetical protein
VQKTEQGMVRGDFPILDKSNSITARNLSGAKPGKKRTTATMLQPEPANLKAKIA